MDSRLLVIGLDGATWDLIEPWVKEGKLPAIKKLMEEGAYGPLESTLPYVTPPAWTSAFTGVNPGKHNIFDFFAFDGNDRRVITARDRKAKAVWQYLSDASIKSLIINVPSTYPPDLIDGVMVAGMGAPGIDSDFVYPKEWKAKLLEHVPDYRIYLDIVQAFAEGEFSSLEKVRQVLRARQNAINFLMQGIDWQFCWLVFMSVDWLQHFFWKYMDQSHPAHTPDVPQEWRHAIYDIYQSLDNIIADLVAGLNEDDYLIVMSDHGGGPLYKDFYVNNMLKELSEDLSTKLKRMAYRPFKDLHLDRNMLVRFDKFGFRKLIPKKAREVIPTSDELERVFEPANNGDTDLSKLKAWNFSLSSQAIRISLEGREPEGAVKAREYEGFRDKIIRKLLAAKDPVTGNRMIKKVYRREEVYHGPYVENAPDLIVCPEAGYVLQEGFNDDIVAPARQSQSDRSGDHRLHGIFMARGPGIRGGIRVESAKVYDITPTILHLFGLPVDRDMDGRVLVSMFDPESDVAKRDVRIVDTKSEGRRIENRIKQLKKLGKI